MSKTLTHLIVSLALAVTAVASSACTASDGDLDGDTDAQAEAFDSDDYVILYKDCSFNGATTVFRPTDNPSEMGDFKYRRWQDQASSIRVGGGARVRICEHPNLGGKCLEISGDNDCFVKDGFNDKASSIQFH